MNNKVIIAIIAVIVVAGAIFMLTRKETNAPVVESNTEATTQRESGVSVETASIKSLIESGKNQKCTFKSSEHNAETAGTMYIAEGKMRGDFTVDASGAKTTSHMMHDGTTSHVWVDGQESGFKMSIDANAHGTTQTQAVDPNKNYEYNCEKWSADRTKFELPAGVTFNEMPTLPSGSMDAGASNSHDTKAMQQAICNNLPEPSKTKCLAAVR